MAYPNEDHKRLASWPALVGVLGADQGWCRPRGRDCKWLANWPYPQLGCQGADWGLGQLGWGLIWAQIRLVGYHTVHHNNPSF